MASNEVAQLLEERNGAVRLRPFASIPRLEELDELPGDDVKRLWEHGWRRVFFMGSYDEEMQAFYHKLRLGKPLGKVSLRLDSALDHAPELCEESHTRLHEQIFRENVDNGSSLIPTLLAIQDAGGKGIDAVDFVACTGGTSWEDYSIGDPAKFHKANFKLSEREACATGPEVAAINGLYAVLAEASDAILADRIS